MEILKKRFARRFISTFVVCIGVALAVSVAEAGLEQAPVIYGMVPPLFGRPVFANATRHLDRLAALGVDVIWLSPITATDDPSAISYSVTDYHKIRSDFGTEQEFRQFVNQAHA